MGEYTLVGRQTSGTNVIGYIVMENRSGCVMPMRKEIVYKLALNKQISDVVAQNYKGKITMKGVKYKISELPVYDSNGNIIQDSEPQENKKIYIVYKVVNGKNTLAYGIEIRVGNRTVNSAVLSRDTIIKLAKQGAIENARYQSSNGKDILRGVRCNIAELPSVAHYSVLNNRNRA